LLVSPLSAQKVGDRLMVVAESAAEVKMDSRTIVAISRGESATVEAVSDAGFRVDYGYGSGWIAKRDVLPVDEAIRYFTKAIANKPRAVDYFARGNAWFEKNQYDKAIADFGEAIRLDPKCHRHLRFGASRTRPKQM